MNKYTVTITDNETNQPVQQNEGSVVLALILKSDGDGALISKLRIWEDNRLNVAFAITKLKEFANTLDKECIADDFILRLMLAKKYKKETTDEN